MTCALPMTDPMRGAEFSEDRAYRYLLWCFWKRTRHLLFLMLNPSVADETELDPTLRRCVGFAESLGYGGIVVVNLFALVSTDPKALLAHEDPVGDAKARRTTLGRTVTNTGAVFDACRNADLVIAGWGAFPKAKERAKEVLNIFRDCAIKVHCLGTTKDGHPKHPLYLAADTRPVPYGGVDG